MANKKSKLIYNIIKVVTLSLPMSLYLFLSATLFNINPDYEIRNITSESVIIEVVDDYTFIYTDDTTAIYQGVVVQYEGKYGFYMDGDDILKLKDGYFSMTDNVLTDIKVFEMKKQLQYALPLTFFISAFGVLVVALVISGKMQWHKKYPRVAVTVALVTGSVILLILDTFISNILNIFLIATASWLLYCIEYKVYTNSLNETQAAKSESDILTALKEALRD